MTLHESDPINKYKAYCKNNNDDDDVLHFVQFKEFCEVFSSASLDTRLCICTGVQMYAMIYCKIPVY